MAKSLFLLLILFFTTTVFAQSPPQLLILGAEDSWPPYTDKQGEGISTNIIRAAFAKEGIQTEIHVRPYARVLQEIKAGVLDGGYNVTRQQNTEAEFIFGHEPILRAKAYWYVSARSPITFSAISQVPDGLRVGGIIDYEYGDIYEQQRKRFREVRVPRQSQLLKMLEAGRIDAAVMFEEEANQALREMRLPANAVRKVMYNHTSDIYVAFSRKKEESAKNAVALDKGLKLLKTSGEYEKLFKLPPPQ
ncbi:MAG: transporter substrate-binding domain-containing protein [Gammaproteobacteria bacterium]|nr:MAG: transporter substrate-binding domain-containing protein [Gammaproteobacteria bacterium]